MDVNPPINGGVYEWVNVALSAWLSITWHYIYLINHEHIASIVSQPQARQNIIKIFSFIIQGINRCKIINQVARQYYKQVNTHTRWINIIIIDTCKEVTHLFLNGWYQCVKVMLNYIMFLVLRWDREIFTCINRFKRWKCNLYRETNGFAFAFIKYWIVFCRLLVSKSSSWLPSHPKAIYLNGVTKKQHVGFLSKLVEYREV